MRLVAQRAARGAKELSPLGDLARLANPAPTAEPAPPRAEPAKALVRADRLLELAAEAGLGDRLEAIGDLAQISGRLARTMVGSRVGFAGGEQRLPSHLSWPERDGQPLALLAVLDLAVLARLGEVPRELPPHGTAWIFAGATAESAHHARVLFDPEAGPAPGERSKPLHLSAELQLPRAWSAAVEPLGLTDSERTAWQLLRTRLAELQGVAAIDGGPAPAPIHRLLGFPDERRGDMPLQCELRARGLDEENVPPRANPHATAVEPDSERWWLLAQLDTDAELGWSWGPRRRLYLWATAAAPGADDPLAIVALVR